MIYTKDEEIEVVRENLKIFENRIPNRFSEQLLQKHVRLTQHGLFFSLCDPRIYPYLLPAIEAIKQYDKPKNFPKAIKKLITNAGWSNQKAVVAEIISVGYFFHKFHGSTDIKVKWERNIPDSTKNVDISLVGLSKFINIEVTAKGLDDRQSRHFELRYKVKVFIEQALEGLHREPFSYIFSLVTRETEGETVTDFSEDNIEDFVDFILNASERGPGKYDFKSNGIILASVTIGKTDKEYATDMDMWTGFMKNEKRIRNRIVDKAREQLPPDDINFVFIPNLGDFDEIDYQEAFWGKEQWHINRSGVQGMSRKPDGAIHIISEKGYSSVYGLIWSKWDFSKKKLLVNPLLKVNANIIKLLE